MIDTISLPSSVFALQLRVILQFYRDKHAELLSREDLLKIDALVDRFGTVDFAPYLITDFERWKEDGRSDIGRPDESRRLPGARSWTRPWTRPLNSHVRPFARFEDPPYKREVPRGWLVRRQPLFPQSRQRREE